MPDPDILNCVLQKVPGGRELGLLVSGHPSAETPQVEDKGQLPQVRAWEQPRCAFPGQEVVSDHKGEPQLGTHNFLSAGVRGPSGVARNLGVSSGFHLLLSTREPSAAAVGPGEMVLDPENSVFRE